MKRILLMLAALTVVTGCAQVPRKPVDVAIMPDDCANSQAIIRWLESVITQTQSRDYPNVNYQSELKNRIWRLRYRCQPA